MKTAWKVGRSKLSWLALLALATFGFYVLEDGCGTREPWSKERPKNVPQAATYVAVVKGYWYVHCWLDSVEKVNRCRVYRSDGTVITDDVYLPYQEQGPLREDRLRVSQRTGSNGSMIVYLEDGGILIARSDYANQKRFVDWVLGKRKTLSDN